MQHSASTSRLARMLSTAAAFALLGGGMIAGAAPASAAVLGHEVSGTVSLLDADGASTVAVGAEVWITPEDENSSIGEREATTGADGSFSFSDIPDGDYTGEVYAAEDEYATHPISFTVNGADLDLGSVVVMEPVQTGTVEIVGDLVPGETITAVTDGWGAGTTFTYRWEHHGHERGGRIDGETSSTLTIEDEWIESQFEVVVTGHKAGLESQWVAAMTEDRVKAPQQATAPAPVPHSAALDAWLLANGSTPQDHDSTIVGDGWSLDPTKNYQAFFWIDSPDSYVDVYVYSEPTVLGTFPVAANGGLFIDLDAELLTELGAGDHTIVVVGQSSGEVVSGEFHISPMLAATGVDPVVPLGAGGALLLLGVGVLLVVRRSRANA